MVKDRLVNRLGGMWILPELGKNALARALGNKLLIAGDDEIHPGVMEGFTFMQTHPETKFNETPWLRHLILVAALSLSAWTIFLFYANYGPGAAIGSLFGLTIAFMFGPSQTLGVAAATLAVQFGAWIPLFSYGITRLALWLDSRGIDQAIPRFWERSVPNEA
jgi:hypothetical protein